ncbi:MAG TPA: hypothetical protein VMM81_03080, partial [Acidimicrobiia bacterium]|nr:hypothetical protein [Acidimicrobiia bacterium]
MRTAGPIGYTTPSGSRSCPVYDETNASVSAVDPLGGTVRRDRAISAMANAPCPLRARVSTG